MSKISDYQLEKIVRDMHNEGKSIRSIAQFLNTQIPKDDEPISEMAVSRWLRADKKQNSPGACGHRTCDLPYSHDWSLRLQRYWLCLC